MQDSEIMGHINTLVEEEHTLRERLQRGDLTADEEHQRLRTVEEQLYQSWDHLRQRRARRDVGENPDEATSRPTGEVEGYLQ
jgi:hypothetical protein